MTDFIENVYLELFNEHGKCDDFIPMSFDRFIGNYYTHCRAGIVSSYMKKNEIFIGVMKEYYLTDPLIYDDGDIVNFFNNIHEYEDVILKTIRLRKLKKLLDIQK